MAILYLATGLGDILHTTSAELIGFRIGSRLMVTALILGREHLLVIADDIVFELTHCLELHTCHLRKGDCCLVERMLWRRLQRMTILIEIGTKHRHSRNLGKRIDESRTEAGQHVEIAASSLDKREEAGTIDTLATGKNRLKRVQIIDDKVKCLQFAVTTRIHEIHHTYLVADNVVNDIGLRKFCRLFSKERYNRVSVHNQMIIVHK